MKTCGSSSLVKAIATGIVLCAIPCSALGVEFGAKVSVWDSSVPVWDPPDPSVDTPQTLPIGGSGEVNGEFVVDTVIFSNPDSAVQVGIRARDRDAGPILTPEGNVYFAATGESEPGLAKWNVDFHIDTGTGDLFDQIFGEGEAGTPLNIHGFAVAILIDLDEGVAINFTGVSVNGNLDDLLGPGGFAILYQTSFNMGAVEGFDPNSPGIYDFQILVLGAENDPVAEASCRVIVGFPDFDNDGVRDDIDECPNSDLSPTVVIGDCDTGIENRLLENGCTLADRILASGSTATNHGQFISGVARLLNELFLARLITGSERTVLQQCAARVK